MKRTRAPTAGSSSSSGSGKPVEIHLKRFQPVKMQTNRICVMIGKKGTGKSTVVEEIMWFQQNIPVGAIMSATEESNEAYSKMAPPLFIYKNFDADALERLINRQKKMKSMFKQNGDSLPFDHRAFLLIDDCMYDKKNFRSPLVRELFMNGRHWDLFVLITIQYLMDITPEIRTNTDYVFAFKENVRNNREKLYKEFFGIFPTFAMFDELYLEVTQDYRCLVLDNTVPSSKIEDCVFWYKAKKRPSFRLGAQWYWDYSEQNTQGRGDPATSDEAKIQEMRQKAVRVVYEKSEDPVVTTALPPRQMQFRPRREWPKLDNVYERPSPPPPPPPSRNAREPSPRPSQQLQIPDYRAGVPPPQRAAYHTQQQKFGGFV